MTSKRPSKTSSNKATASPSSSSPTANFQLTEFESTLLQSDLQHRFSLWTDQWKKTQDQSMRTANERDQRERKMWEMRPKNDASSSIRALNDSVCKMLELVDEIEKKIPTLGDEKDTRDVVPDLLAKVKRNGKKASRCRETALDIQWKVLQPESVSQSQAKSVNELPQQARPAAVSMIAHGRSLRSIQTPTGAIPQHQLETEAASMVYQGWKQYLRQQQVKKPDVKPDPPPLVFDDLYN